MIKTDYAKKQPRIWTQNKLKWQECCKCCIKQKMY